MNLLTERRVIEEETRVSLVLSYEQAVKSAMVTPCSPPCSVVLMQLKHSKHLLNKCMP